jgi:Calcium/calmodulin dependent protein kinase II association domain
MSEVRAFLEKHLQAIFDGDVDHYRGTAVPELTLYEWYVTPHRIDGLPFHDFMMTEARRAGATPMTCTALADSALTTSEQTRSLARTRFDLANYQEQRYGDTVIASYTLLVSQSTERGVVVRSHNESRVLINFPDGWKVVHVHKSPAWNAPFQPPHL